MGLFLVGAAVVFLLLVAYIANLLYRVVRYLGVIARLFMAEDERRRADEDEHLRQVREVVASGLKDAGVTAAARPIEVPGHEFVCNVCGKTEANGNHGEPPKFGYVMAPGEYPVHSFVPVPACGDCGHAEHDPNANHRKPGALTDGPVVESGPYPHVFRAVGDPGPIE